MADIQKGAMQLRKVEHDKKNLHKKKANQPVNEVAAILARRAALEQSDSDSGMFMFCFNGVTINAILILVFLSPLSIQTNQQTLTLIMRRTGSKKCRFFLNNEYNSIFN